MQISMIRRLALAIVLIVTVSACGDAAPSTSEAKVLGEQSSPEPDEAEGDTSDSDAPDSEDADEGADETSDNSVGAVDLAVGPISQDDVGALFAKTSAADSHLITASTATSQIMPVLGVSTVQELDLDRPTTTSIVTPEGTHTSIDLALLAPALLEHFEPGEVTIEMWQSGTEVVTDTSSYERIVALNPAADLGAFRPGVFSLNFAGHDDVSAEDMAKLVGADTVDLDKLSRDLPNALDNLEVASTNPTTITGTVMYSDLIAAHGNDPEVAARSAAAGVATATGLDPILLGDAYLSAYDSTQATVSLQISDDGYLEAVTSFADLSSVFESVIESGVFDDLGAQGILLKTAFTGGVLSIEIHSQFVVLDDLEMPIAPNPTEDRTDEFIKMMTDAGLIDG